MTDNLKDLKLEAEPAVYFDGKVSDASEHRPMLDNPVASAMSDAMAREVAVRLGFTPEEMALLDGPMPVPEGSVV